MHIPGKKTGLPIRLLACLLGAALTAAASAAAPAYPVVWFGTVFALPKVTRQIALQAQLAQSLGKGFDVPVGGGATFKVTSCNDLFAADARGLDMRGAAHEAYRYFALSCYAARAISQARPAKTSTVQDFKLDEAAVRQLPSTLWMVAVDTDRAQPGASGPRFGERVGTAQYKVTDTADSRQVEVTDAHGNDQDVAWVARGDFDHDGNEDLLLATHDSRAGSDAQTFQLVVLSRRAAAAPLVVVQRFAVNGPHPRPS